MTRDLRTWLKIDADFWKNPKIRKANQATGCPTPGMIAQVLLIANQSRKRNGRLRPGDIEGAQLAPDLAAATGCYDEDRAEAAVSALVVSGFLRRTDDGGAEITGWDDDWTGPKSDAERKRDQRTRDRSANQADPDQSRDASRESRDLSRDVRDMSRRPRDTVTPRNKDIEREEREEQQTSAPASPDVPSDLLEVLVLVGFGLGQRDREATAATLRSLHVAADDLRTLLAYWEQDPGVDNAHALLRSRVRLAQGGKKRRDKPDVAPLKRAIGEALKWRDSTQGAVLEFPTREAIGG